MNKTSDNRCSKAQQTATMRLCVCSNVAQKLENAHVITEVKTE